MWAGGGGVIYNPPRPNVRPAGPHDVSSDDGNAPFILAYNEMCPRSPGRACPRACLQLPGCPWPDRWVAGEHRACMGHSQGHSEMRRHAVSADSPVSALGRRHVCVCRHLPGCAAAWSSANNQNRLHRAVQPGAENAQDYIGVIPFILILNANGGRSERRKSWTWRHGGGSAEGAGPAGLHAERSSEATQRLVIQ